MKPTHQIARGKKLHRVPLIRLSKIPCTYFPCGFYVYYILLFPSLSVFFYCECMNRVVTSMERVWRW